MKKLIGLALLSGVIVTGCVQQDPHQSKPEAYEITEVVIGTETSYFADRAFDDLTYPKAFFTEDDIVGERPHLNEIVYISFDENGENPVVTMSTTK